MKEQILSKLAPGHPWGGLLQYYPVLDSTNTLAKSLAAQGVPHGTVIVAGSQTGGRGRMGRSFHSPEGSGLYFSAILRPNCDAAELMHLTCAVAVAVRDAIAKCTGLNTGIKWINDLTCGSKKVAGILTELTLVPGSSKVSCAIVGIGINCRQQEEDFPPELRSIAGSLSMAAGRDVSPADLAAAIEQGRPPRTSYRQTYHVLEVMTGIMKSAETGVPYVLTTKFEREAPMDPTMPHGVL